MQIDDNPDMREHMRLEKLGRRPEADAIRDVFVQDILASMASGEEHCSCATAACPYHGKCLECVMIHRGHQDHLPNCLKPVARQGAATPV